MSDSSRRPEAVSVWRAPGMPALLATTALGFAGFAALMPVAPLWARHIGADEAGAGLVNAVLMVATVAFQTGVPWALRTLGWRTTFVAGLILLGAPSAFFALATTLPAVLALSAVRGAGFAVLTVCGASAVAHLVAPSHRGRAIGAYGLAIALPQVVLVPGAPLIAEHVGFGAVFAIGAVPIVAVPFAAILGARVDRAAPDDDEPDAGRVGLRTVLALAVPAVVLLAVTTPGGALITFAAQLPYPPLVATIGLLALTGIAAFARWLAGGLADRYGPYRFMWPLLLLSAAALCAVAWAAGGGAPFALIAGMFLVGIAYGALQNLTLVASFAAVPNRMRDTASTVWNIGFDAGTGLGSLAVGFIAAGTSFGTAFLVTAALSLAVAAFIGLRYARAIGRARRAPAN
ncbi:MFS transporter [Microbacterium halophytorum]|uniref:MFS transporter n=1 Tax=Microbacterium halophytorum TaxID=2067568 RepID=UPI001E5B0D9F|nr:MFS transporter [Microbacterium halophytorum]